MVLGTGRLSQSIRTKALVRNQRVWNQRRNFTSRAQGFRRGPYEGWEYYPEADFPVDYYRHGSYPGIKGPNRARYRTRPSQLPKPRTGRPGGTRLEPKWIYRPRPRDDEDEGKPIFPNLPDLPPGDIPGEDIPDIEIDIPGEDIVIDDPFIPIDESDEAEDEGEKVRDPGRDQFPPLPQCSNDPDEQALYNIPPCSSHGNAFQIQTQKAKFRKKGSHGSPYRKGRQRYYPF